MTAEHFVDVYRLEHVNCDRGTPGHGPYYRPRIEPDTLEVCDYPPSSRCVGWGFGGAHYGPGQFIEAHEQCGVTVEQFSAWVDSYHGLSAATVSGWVKGGWSFVHYSVPVEDMRSVYGQIMFPTRDVYRVGLIEWDEVQRLADAPRRKLPTDPEEVLVGAQVVEAELPTRTPKERPTSPLQPISFDFGAPWINDPMKWSAMVSSVSSL